MKARRTDDLLIIIARAPIAGATKTRLGATIGMDRAAALHRAFIADLAARFGPPGACPFDVVWSVTPESFDFHGLLSVLLPDLDPQPDTVVQVGDCFADRLTWLFQLAFEGGYQRVQIMASDSPHLPIDHFARGFELLCESDVVLGRVDDGGYYVIGMRDCFPLLEQSVMSTGRAADGLIENARRLALTVAETPPSFDVDTESDLETLIELLSATPEAAPRTWAALLELRLAERPEHQLVTTFIRARN